MKFKLHRVFDGEDEVIGAFEIQDDKIIFPSDLDQHHCDMFPPGAMSQHTMNRILSLLNHKTKTMYLEKIE
jgi:hypothetical protein